MYIHMSLDNNIFSQSCHKAELFIDVCKLTNHYSPFLEAKEPKTVRNLSCDSHTFRNNMRCIYVYYKVTRRIVMRNVLLYMVCMRERTQLSN